MNGLCKKILPHRLLRCGKEAAKMWPSIVGILGVNLTRYALADVENLTSGNEIDFNSLLQPKTALFILYDDFGVLFKD